MTRHGLVEPTAAGTKPTAMVPHAPRAIDDANMCPPGPVPGRQYCAKEQRSGLSAFTVELPSGGRDIADIGRLPGSSRLRWPGSSEKA